jgi:hypothetical protein
MIERQLKKVDEIRKVIRDTPPMPRRVAEIGERLAGPEAAVGVEPLIAQDVTFAQK